ncbi:hypothetical protein FKM82_028551 [Ascaphus truei]
MYIYPNVVNDTSYKTGSGHSIKWASCLLSRPRIWRSPIITSWKPDRARGLSPEWDIRISKKYLYTCDLTSVVTAKPLDATVLCHHFLP